MTTTTTAASMSAALPPTFHPEIAIVGLGYVGLPLAMTFADGGATVLGIDLDERKVRSIRAGDSYIEDIPSDQVARHVEEGRFQATTRFGELAKAQTIIIAVPTPLNKNREPDLSYVEGAAKRIAPHLQAGQLVVLESTTYPGTTRELVLPILAADGLTVGEDFYLAYSPERVDPGNERFTTKNTPKVVGGITPACTERAAEVYGRAIDTMCVVSTPEAAEMTKLLENIFRSVNIALVNELAMLCDRMQVDIWEVVEAASTKPFGFMKFTPGPGLGGHCIPIDPFYLTWKAREYDFSTEFIELAGKINSNMPYWCVQKLRRALNEDEKSIKGARILLLGMAYKKNVGDVRESPSMKVAELLLKAGADVRYHDSYAESVTLDDGTKLSGVALDGEVEAADVVVVLTDHDGIDYEDLARRAQRTVDFRNVTGETGKALDSVWKL